MSQLEIAAVLDAGAHARIEKERVAHHYLASLPKSQRRAEGRVYTPTHLVDFVLSLAEHDPAKDLEHCRVLDPACGGGAFLVAATLRLADRMRSIGVRLQTARGADRFLRACERTLFGIDVDPDACDLSCEAVRAVASKIVTPQEVPETFFSQNVIEANFLLDREVDALGPRAGFDLIVGNPPYVSTNRLSTDAKDLFRTRFRTANGRIDLYVLFFERSLELLGPRGRLAFITPNKYLTSVSASPLRELLQQTASVRKIAEFDSHKVFNDAATVPCITVIDRERISSSTIYLQCKATPEAVNVRRESRHDLPKAAWRLHAPGVLDLLERVRGSHPPLSEYATRISAGVATGLDRVFVLPTEQADQLCLERALRRPAIRGKDVQAGSFRDSNLVAIIPYESDAEQSPRLVNIEDYPATHAYLRRHRNQLEKRHCVRTWGKRWYDIHDPWTLDITTVSKIVVPDIAFSNRFATDRGGHCPLHSAYYIIPTHTQDTDYLTAILNSDIIEFCIRASAPIVKDGFIRYRKQFLQTLPIPHATQGQRRALADACAEHTRFDVEIAGIFGLTDSELQSVRSHLDELRNSHAPRSGTR